MPTRILPLGPDTYLKGKSGADDDDNFAFIDNLLDTLQTEGGHCERSRTCSKVSCGHGVGEGVDAWGTDVQSRSAGLAAAVTEVQRAAGESEPWSVMLSRYCENGDESVVDVLLDSFLRSTSDAKSLIDAIACCPSAARAPIAPRARSAFAKPARLSVPKAKSSLPKLDLNSQELDRHSFDVFDALLNSARGLLQSHRSSSSSVATPSARSPLALAATNDASATEEAHEPRQPVAAEATGAPPATSAPGGVVARGPPRGAVADEELTLSSSAMLARLAEMEDHEAMRDFLRHFLVGVRHRYWKGCQAGSNAQADCLDDSADEEEEDEESIWSCRSVNTVSVES